MPPTTSCVSCRSPIDQLGRHPRYYARHCDACKAESQHADQARRRAAPITPEARTAVIARDGMCCVYCGRPVMERADRYGSDDTIELDHVVPLSLGGDSSPANLVVACRHCNRAHHNRPKPRREAAHV